MTQWTDFLKKATKYVNVIKERQVTSMVSNLLPEATSYPALISDKHLRQNSQSSLTDATNGTVPPSASQQCFNSLYSQHYCV